MIYDLLYSKSYEKKEVKFLKKHPQLSGIYQNTLQLLKVNPQHPSLRLHKLKGKLHDFHSVSMTISYRIVIDFVITDTNIILIDIGDHDEVYT